MNTVRITRVLLGGLYVVGAVVHVFFTLFLPDLYQVFADMALVAAYRDLWLSVVVPSLWFLLPAVILFEGGIALAIVWHGRVVTLATLAGAMFQLGLVLSGPWGFINLGLADIHLYLARFDFRHPAITLRNDSVASIHRIDALIGQFTSSCFSFRV